MTVGAINQSSYITTYLKYNFVFILVIIFIYFILGLLEVSDLYVNCFSVWPSFHIRLEETQNNCVYNLLNL